MIKKYVLFLFLITSFSFVHATFSSTDMFDECYLESLEFSLI